MALLRVEQVRKTFGGLVALNNVTFNVEPGQIKAVIGPNGAGKTTLFNIIAGVFTPDTGEVQLEDHRITGSRPHQIARLGLSRTFQAVSLFPQMTVLENVMVGRHCRTRSGMLASALRLPRQRREEAAMRDDAMERLAFVGMTDQAEQPVGDLSFGQRRMIELARALATEPRIVLLDEPASGLNSRETDDLCELIVKTRDSGVTVLLVEHDMSLVMEVSDDILVLNFGEPIAEGDPASVRGNPKVVEVYLGGEFDGA